MNWPLSKVGEVGVKYSEKKEVRKFRYSLVTGSILSFDCGN